MTEDHPLTVTVHAELADSFEAHAHLLTPGTVDLTSRTAEPDRLAYTYLLCHPHAPAEATTAEPVYRHSADGTVRLAGIGWFDTDGHYLGAWQPDGPAH
ncbi:hypothetical protein ACFZC3_15445 [Streptomyces sp. NPDC007903]|uniref:hypothetical protein n=1 Tax=Streptomyces sp. NPDC007903 TaxID=3364786 RepID=UPI0036E0F942